MFSTKHMNTKLAIDFAYHSSPPNTNQEVRLLRQPLCSHKILQLIYGTQQHTVN